MPIALVLAYLEMLPRLQAEEQLESARLVRLGTSAQLPIDSVKDIERALDRAANPNRKRARGVRAKPADLAAMGIGIVSAPPEGALSDG